MLAEETPSTTMRAWVFNGNKGGLEKSMQLLDNVQRPEPGKDEVLLKVLAVSLNPVDYKIAEAGLISRGALKLPCTPGLDVAGVVTESKLDGYKKGDRVMGRLSPFPKNGGLGEFVVLQRTGLTLLPSSISFEEGCAVGTAALTAWQSIAPNVSSGDKVFINGGSGGTGSFGIQIAKALGCTVVTSCSTRNIDFCRTLGADEVIDYTTSSVCEALKAKGAVFKLAVDNVGIDPPDLYKACDTFLVPEGKFIQVGAHFSVPSARVLLGRMLTPSIFGGGHRKYVFMAAKNDQADLEKLAILIQERKVKPVIDEMFPFDKAPEAITKLKNGRARGKIVVKVSSIL
eukprot:Protomagalhaensia_wolfi_Nauph_80__123@NODE_106_length_3690_cov_178_707204_g80_i0_p3_GENE_NODE_106_length_3690_cov_178_707204_g80_i0NODE_106_length_3690_cov_178_707204_g80_i0_p3_ORF_typecomplete_len343_score44_44ADH_zinc_N_2/PF13602_6/5_9e23ADH_zinc_N/PF00107_26/9_1e13ADH_N/PF08240_12/1_9e09ADH_N/PF08240_12/1e03ADH_N_2/PF16884_5/0_00054Crp/PF00325_20/8_2e03Crp/PF00325_20/0_34_NODE_106_length_3690_cov_178_707204_g80_i011602188